MGRDGWCLSSRVWCGSFAVRSDLSGDDLVVNLEMRSTTLLAQWVTGY